MQQASEHGFFSSVKAHPSATSSPSLSSPALSLVFLAEMAIDANEIIKKIKRNLLPEKTDKDSFNSLKMLVEYLELSVYDMMTYAGCDQPVSEKKDKLSVLFEKLRYFSRLSKKKKVPVSIEIDIEDVLKNYSVNYRSRPANTYFKALLVVIENAVKYMDGEKPGKIRVKASIVGGNFQVRVLDTSALIKNPESIFNPQKELVLEEIVQQKTVRESWHIGIPASVKNMRNLPGGDMRYSEQLTDKEKREGFTKCVIVELPMTILFEDEDEDNVMDIRDLLEQLTEKERKSVIYYDTHGGKNMAAAALLLNLWQEMKTLFEELLDVLERVNCGKNTKLAQIKQLTPNTQGVALGRNSVIIVIDDDPNMLMGIGRILQSTLKSIIGVNDITILSFSSAEKALKEITTQCSLVFTDYNMEGDDGVMFAQKLQAKFKDEFKAKSPPIVLLTADSHMLRHDKNFPLDLFAHVIDKGTSLRINIQSILQSFLQSPKASPKGKVNVASTRASEFIVDTKEPEPPSCYCSIY